MTTTVEIDSAKLALIHKAEAADEQRVDAEQRLGEWKSEWAESKKSREDSRDALFVAMDEIRKDRGESRDGWTEEETARIDGLYADYERRYKYHETVDREKKKAEYRAKQMTEVTLARLGEIRDPDMYAMGAKHGPDAWKNLELVNLVGPELSGTVMKYAEVGNVGNYVLRRAGQIPASLNDDFDDEAMRTVDRAVYTFMERRELESHWPVDVPEGCQTTLTTQQRDEVEADGSVVEQKGDGASSAPKTDGDGEAGGAEGAAGHIRVVGHDRAEQVAKKHDYRIDEKGKPTQDRDKAVERAEQYCKRNRRAPSIEEGMIGVFVLERADGLFQVALFEHAP